MVNGTTNGIYTLEETSNKNIFWFYRNDGRELTENIEKELYELYHSYIIQKKKKDDMKNKEILLDITDDKKAMRLIIKEKKNPDNEQPKNDFLKQLFHKILE